MTDTHAPIICVTCQREFPDDFNKDNAPKYFAQYGLQPTAYDWDHFGNEARTLTDYMTAVADLIRYANQDIEDETYRTIFQLMGELSEEVDRRLKHFLDAMEAEWKRNKEASEKAPHARKDGV